MRKQSLGIFALATGLTLSIGSCSKAPPPPPKAVAVTATCPMQCDMPLYNEYVGHIQAFLHVEVKSQIAGTLMSQHFKEGQFVKKGDLLFTIDPRPYEAALAKAEAALALSLANLKYAEETASRYSKLVQDDYVAKLQYDQYLTNVLVEEATIKENIADIETAKLNLGYCYITAPMDALTGNVQLEVGNYITVGGENPLMILNQITPIYLYFYVPEKDLPEIQEKNAQGTLRTQVFLNQDFDHPFEGDLSLINNQVEETTGTILLKAIFPNEDHRLWPGEFVDVRLILGEEKNALLIPNQAIQIGIKGYFVFVVKEDQTVEMRSIQLGQRYKDYTIIKKGLKMGETVVLDGQLNLYQGAKVTIKPPSEVKTSLGVGTNL